MTGFTPLALRLPVSAQERAAAQLAAARAETAAANAALDAASAARDEALAWGEKVRAVEASAVAAVRAGAKGSSSSSSAATPAVVEADWDLVPGFAVVLPGLAAAVGELRAEARRAARRQRVAEAEVGDLSEELALLRVEAGADALGRSIATGDVRAALRMARAERDQLRSDVDALRSQQVRPWVARARAQTHPGACFTTGPPLSRAGDPARPPRRGS